MVVVPGLGCPEACGIVPDQGLNLCLLRWQADSNPLSHQGSPGLFLRTFVVDFFLSVFNDLLIHILYLILLAIRLVLGITEVRILKV